MKKSLLYKIKAEKKYDEVNFDIICSKLESLNYDDALIYKITLVVEEFITNILKYSNNKGEISLAINFSPKLIIINIADYGEMFDPLEIKTHALIDSVDDAKIGGLGIHIIKNIANAISYHRVGGNNITKVIISNPKRLTKPATKNNAITDSLVFEDFKRKAQSESITDSPVACFL